MTDHDVRPGYRLLAVDSGFANMGLALVEFTPGPALLDTRWVRTKPTPKKRRPYQADDNARRIVELATALDEFRHGDTLISEVGRSPHAVAVEHPQGSKSATAMRAMGMAWAVVVGWAHHNNLPLVQVRPQEVKEFLCGKANASKTDVARAVAARCPFGGVGRPIESASLSEHEFDAVGVALTAASSELLRAAIRGA